MSGSGRRPEWRLFVAALVLVDAAMALAAFVLAYLVRYKLGWLALQEATPQQRNYIVITLFALPVWTSIFAACGLYRRDLLLGGPQEYARLVNACTYGFAAVAVLSFLSGGEPAVSRGWLVASWPLAMLTTGMGRFTMRRIAYRLRRWGLFISRAVIVGANAQGVAIARQIDDPRANGMRVIGFLDDYLPAAGQVDGRWPVLGPPAALDRLAVDEAIVVQHALTWESLHDLMCGLAGGAPGPAIRLAPTFFDLLTAGMSVSQRANVPVIVVDRSRITGLDAVVKTGFEYALAAVLLLALSPLLLWKALSRAWSGRPVLERRRYAGARGRVVVVRSFPEEAPESARVRRLIEKGPALVSVLRGDVALVGPRLMPAGGGEATERLALLSVRPGLTGPVSVVGAELSPEAALALELSYLRNYSIWRDLQLVWQRALLLFRPRDSHQAERPAAAPPAHEGVARAPARNSEVR